MARGRPGLHGQHADGGRIDDADYAVVHRDVVGPVLDEFRPELVLVSAGFDAHERDPLASMRMTTPGYAIVIQQLRDVGDPPWRARPRDRRRLRADGAGGMPGGVDLGARGTHRRTPTLQRHAARARSRWSAVRWRPSGVDYNYRIVPDYKPQTIEKKWQDRWRRERTFEVTEDDPRPKFYCLEMFAYPSGHAHVGHVRNYMIGDVVARMKRMRGFNVLHPFGWDAFGLPAENAAIKGRMHPETWTLENIAHMKGQLQRIGISYAWEREIATCLPDYYHWNQWLFLKMLERDLAFRKRSNVNWCPSCNTVLANEQVVDGGCWRCGTPVTTRELEQWFFRITHYADELLEAADRLPGWPDKVLTMQRNWIGRSEGARVTFALAPRDRGSGIRGVRLRRRADPDPGSPSPGSIDVFTTRIDTIYGANFLMLAPEHSLVQQWSREGQPGFAETLKRFQAQDRTARMTGEIEKEGFDTGRTAINPFTKRPVPIWVANFVLGEYGTGAVMGVPGHDQRDFEFARKYSLPITIVIQPEGQALAADALDRGIRRPRQPGELGRVRRADLARTLSRR